MSKAILSVIPTFRYQDAPAAIEFLTSAFGFEKHLVVPDDAGGIAHAQLSFGGGTGMIMLGSARDDEFGRLVSTPAAAGTTTSSPYVIVEDVDSHYQRARTAGAEIVREPVDESYGGRGYACKDPEGHVWSFGSYDPLAEH